MKIERLISIIYKLLNHEVLSASALAEQFEVSPRTIYRDIDVICAAGFPVISHQGMHGGYGMMDGYKLDKTLLGSYDVASLITVLHSLSTIFEEDHIQGTIERLQSIEVKRPSGLTMNFESKHMNSEVLRQLRQAIDSQKVIRLDYVNSSNVRSIRDLEPVQLHFKYNSWYLYGYCRSRQDYREFRISRILQLQIIHEHFTNHNLSTAVSTNALENKQKIINIVVRVAPEALAEALDHFHQVEKELHADGSMILHIPIDQTQQNRWLISVLMSFGGRIEVLEPNEFRQQIKEQLQYALTLYEEV